MIVIFLVLRSYISNEFSNSEEGDVIKTDRIDWSLTFVVKFKCVFWYLTAKKETTNEQKIVKEN